MSEIVGAGVGGFLGGLAGNILSQQIPQLQPQVLGRVQLEPYKFYGVKTLVVSNSPVQILSESLAIKAVLLKADKSNGNIIWIGRSSVSIRDGFPLDAGDTLSLAISNANDIWAVAEGNQKLYVVFLGE